MSKKRRRSSPPRRQMERRPAPRREPARRGLSGFLFRPPLPPVFPSIRSSLGRGLLVVATTPALLVGAALLVLAAWVVMLALGLEAPPGRLVVVLALPPISIELDAGNGSSLYGVSWQMLVFAHGFFLFRSLALAAGVGVLVARLEGGEASLGTALRGLRATPAILAVHIASFGIQFVGNILLSLLLGSLGSFLGVLLLLVVLGAFAFVPVAAVREERGVLETLARSARAARLPSGHGVMVMLYFLLALLAVALAPQGGVITANPSLAQWVYILLATYLQMAFLAAFAYRWIVVEQAVPERARR